MQAEVFATIGEEPPSARVPRGRTLGCCYPETWQCAQGYVGAKRYTGGRFNVRAMHAGAKEIAPRRKPIPRWQIVGRKTDWAEI